MRRALLLCGLALSSLALVACGSSGGSSYVPPPRQQPVLLDSRDLSRCSSLTMGGSSVLVSLCDPVALSSATAGHRLTEPGTVVVTVPGRVVTVGSSPGLTQVLPGDGLGSLRAPTAITVRGTAGAGTYLYVRAASLGPLHVATGEALFRDLGLARGGAATLEVAISRGALVFRLHRPDGGVAKPFRL